MSIFLGALRDEVGMENDRRDYSHENRRDFKNEQSVDNPPQYGFRFNEGQHPVGMSYSQTSQKVGAINNHLRLLQK